MKQIVQRFQISTFWTFWLAAQYNEILYEGAFLFVTEITYICPNVSTTPITAMGCWQCLPLSVVHLKGKHCRKPHCRNGIVDNEVFILSGSCMNYGQPEAHASLSHAGCVLRQYLMFRKKRCHMLF